MTLQACYEDSVLHATKSASDQDLIFLPTKHLIPQQTSEVAIS